MKKIFIALLVIPFITTTKAQNKNYIETSYDSTISFVKDDAQMVAKRLSQTSDFNVLINNNRLISSYSHYNTFRYFKGFVDTSLNNTFKKVNDSVYKIQINNPMKEILLVGSNINGGEYNNSWSTIKPTGQFNSPEIMGKAYKTINYKTDSSVITYNVQPFNPFVSQIAFELRDSKTEKLIRRFVFHYNFPKPILMMATSNDTLIKGKKNNPSLVFGMASNNPSRNKMPQSFNERSVLFIFEHFCREVRKNYDDVLLYKIDSAADWSFTAISYTPSILLENLAPGNHTLYVKYASLKENILKCHFTITPN